LSRASYSDLLNIVATSKTNLRTVMALFMEDSGNIYLSKLFNALAA